MKPFDRRSVLVIVFVGGLSIRLLLAALFYGSGDVNIWGFFANFWPAGKSPYESFFYNYAPPWYWIISLMGAVSRATEWPFYFLIKCPLILGDLALFALIYRGAKKLSNGDSRAALVAGSAFFLNPVSIILTGCHGAFDNLSILFVLLGWYAFCFYPAGRNTLAGTFFFAFGVCVKHFNILLAPAFAFRQKNLFHKLLVLAAAPALLALMVLPYAGSGIDTVLHNMFGWSLHAGYWGWSGFICRSALFFTGIDLIQKPWFGMIDNFNLVVYVAIFLASIYWAKRRDLLDSLLLVFLLFYTFTTQIAPQYTLWILPLAALRPNRFFYAYSLAGGLQVGFFEYCHYHWYNHVPFAAGLPELASPAFVLTRYLTWAVCAVWFFSLARARSRATL